MKVLVLAGDESILVAGSSSYDRMCEYAELFDELHMLVASRTDRPAATFGRLNTYAAPGKSALVRSLRMLRRGSLLCGRVRPDVLSSDTPDVFGLVGLWLSHHYRVPLQLQVHTDIFSPLYRRASWKERIRFHIARFVLPRAACIRVVSERIATSLTRELSIPTGRIHVLPIRTDVSEIRSAPRSALEDGLRAYDLRLVSAGRFVDREKNFSLLIDVMTEVAGDVPRSLLVIAGDGPDRKLLERRILSLGLAQHVRIEPWRSDLPSFLKWFDVFVLSSNFEGWPRVCIEAMAAGVPVITTDVGMVGELLVDGETAKVVPPGDRLAMSAAILSLYRDPRQRRHLAETASRAVERLPYRSKADYLRRYAEAMQACLGR